MQNSLLQTTHIEGTLLASDYLYDQPQSNLQNKLQHIRIEKIKLLYQQSLTPIILSAVVSM